MQRISFQNCYFAQIFSTENQPIFQDIYQLLFQRDYKGLNLSVFKKNLINKIIVIIIIIVVVYRG